jgi:hypothetical protein
VNGLLLVVADCLKWVRVLSEVLACCELWLKHRLTAIGAAGWGKHVLGLLGPKLSDLKIVTKVHENRVFLD